MSKHSIQVVLVSWSWWKQENNFVVCILSCSVVVRLGQCPRPLGAALIPGCFAGLWVTIGCITYPTSDSTQNVRCILLFSGFRSTSSVSLAMSVNFPNPPNLAYNVLFTEVCSWVDTLCWLITCAWQMRRYLHEMGVWLVSCSKGHLRESGNKPMNGQRKNAVTYCRSACPSSTTGLSCPNLICPPPHHHLRLPS